MNGLWVARRALHVFDHPKVHSNRSIGFHIAPGVTQEGGGADGEGS